MKTKLSRFFGVFACFLAARIANGNTADFNNDGHADFLYYNKTTRKLTVWLMNGTTKIGSPIDITQNGQPIIAEANWKLVGVGRFDTSGQNRLSILWQEQSNGAMAVWFMKTTGTQTDLDTSSPVTPGPEAGWRAAAVGNFDGQGTSDIAFEHTGNGSKVVWIMNGTAYSTSWPFLYYQLDWHITGAGDFGTISSGAKDCKDDLLLCYYNPATDNAYTNLNNTAGIWFMNGTGGITSSAVMADGKNLLFDSPDWRFVAAGNFDNDTGAGASGCNITGRTDIVVRDAVTGRQGAWYLDGKTFQSGVFFEAQPDPAWKLYSQDWMQSTWRHKDIYPTITATASANGGLATVTLSYRIKPSGSNGIEVKRRTAGGSWTTLTSGVTETVTTDSNLTPGTRYEYEVHRIGADFTTPNWARIFACANQDPSIMANRGKILVIVESSIFSGIAAGLRTFTNDLIGDGWSVALAVNAPRHLDSVASHPECASVTCTQTGTEIVYPLISGSNNATDLVNRDNRNTVKEMITNPVIVNLKGIVLIGHVTIPLSGFDADDGHCNHEGAWVADAWYGHSGNGWTDSTTRAQPCVWDQTPWNYNVSGDGKFDNSTIPLPSEFTKFVGRIDFARLPEFGTGTASEVNLITTYLAKNHAYRTNTLKFENKVVAYSTHSITLKLDSQGQLPLGQSHYYDDSAYTRSFRHLSPLVGSGFDRFVIGHAFHQKTDSYLWGFLHGNGGPTYVCETQPGGPFSVENRFLEYTTQEIHNELEPRIAFYHLYGSYFLDWYFNNDFMRAALALPNSGLAAVWNFGWAFEGLGLGEPLGETMTRTIQDITLGLSLKRSMSILGDPTLRATILAPPKSVNYSGGQLSWTAPDNTGGWQYYVYSASSMSGNFTHASSVSPTSGTSVTISNPGVLMVRAAKAVTTGSGTFTSLSQGAFYPNPYQ